MSISDMDMIGENTSMASHKSLDLYKLVVTVL